jgi:molecular chaperone GrpE
MKEDSKRGNKTNSEDELVFEDEFVKDQKTSDKVRELKRELDLANKERMKHLEDLQRAKADFINMRRRDEADRDRFLKLSKEEILVQLLPIMDSFESAYKEESWKETPNNFRKGIEMIAGQLKTILQNNGVVAIDSVIGAQFNPALETAVGTEKTTKEVEDHTIAEIIQTGYMLHDKVLRSPKVSIKEFQPE